MTVKTWVADELVFKSTKKYDNPFEDVDISAVFTSGKQKIVVPGFWDGDDTWKVRFALNKEGLWNYTVTCTDKENIGLQGTGKVECVKYDGEYEIYKRGFLKTEPNVRYFMYADGTPFFYLGDTHWNMFDEEFDNGGDFDCPSHFKYIVDKRVEQGFNVYQSEPIGARFDISDGIDEKDVEGFKLADKYFDYIAQNEGQNTRCQRRC